MHDAPSDGVVVGTRGRGGRRPAPHGARADRRRGEATGARLAPRRSALPAWRWLPVLLALAAWAPAASAATRAEVAERRPPSRLRLVRPGAPLVPGQQASLRIETTGENGDLLPVPRPVVVSIFGAAGLTATTRVMVPAGSAAVEVPITAARPGVWQVEVRGEGLYSASTVVACVHPAVLQSHQAVAAARARRAAGAGAAPAGAPPAAAAKPPGAPAATARAAGPPAARPAAAPQALFRAARPNSPAFAAPGAHLEEERLRAEAPAPGPAPAPASRSARPNAAARPAAAAGRESAAAPAAGTAPAGTAEPGATAGGPATSPPAATAKSGEVRLIPEHLERYRGAQGWESVSVDAYWYENGNPNPVPRELELALVSDGGDLLIDPVRLSIPSGDFVSKQPAKVTAAAARKATLRALYPGGQSNLVDVSFLAAPATRLSFASGPQVIRAFGVVSTEVYVRLLDAAGMPAVADRPIKVNLQLSGPIGSPQLQPAVINAGEIETRAPLELPRFGAYTVLAAASDLADAPPLAIEVTFDWLLLVVILLGGLLGSLARVLYQGQSADATPRRLLRVLLLGGLAALLVVLLSAFGLLSLLASALPQGFTDALARIPLGSLTGVFLLGFLAGLLFDRIFGGLVSPGGGRADAKPPAAPAAPGGQ